MKNKIYSDFQYNEQINRKGSLVIAFRKVIGLIARVTPLNRIRVFLYRVMGVKIGENVYVARYCIIDDTFPELITIEKEVILSYGTVIVAHDASKNNISEVIVKKRSFIGARAVILPGIIIGESTVIGAGAVVTKSIPGNVTALGVPARFYNKSDNK